MTVWSLGTLGVLGALGVLISSYFTAVAYRVVSPDTRWVPSFCRMEDKTCASIVFTPQARVFGLPNSVLGQCFYLAILVGCAVNGIVYPLSMAYLAASAITVALGVYLTYSLLFITRVRCPLCFLSHAINLIIFAILGLMVWFESNP